MRPRPQRKSSAAFCVKSAWRSLRNRRFTTDFFCFLAKYLEDMSECQHEARRSVLLSSARALAKIARRYARRLVHQARATADRNEKCGAAFDARPDRASFRGETEEFRPARLYRRELAGPCECRSVEIASNPDQSRQQCTQNSRPSVL